MPILELKSVCKQYIADGHVSEVLHNVNLSIEEGEFVAIVGFSGSGKTTLINSIAGLITPDSGEILLRGKAITGASHDRGLVFQTYSLFPWLTVRGNILMAVAAVFPQWSKAQQLEHVQKYIGMVSLSHAAERRPAELSGGMRQRVAVARALAMNPEILLLDEPLSALDALTRAKLQDEIESIWEQNKKTVVLITNDVDEALLLADRIIPLTVAPRATLGKEFKVNLARPRDRKNVNHDEGYKKLRAEITAYLLNMGAERGSDREERAAPTVVPMTATSRLPDSVRKEAKPKPAEDVNKYVEFYQVSKTFPTPKGPLTVVDKFSLNMRKGEFISLIGHSGCGKSTVLSMIAGLSDVSDGSIVLDSREVSNAGPDRGVVFQSPNLLPWLTARQNVALGVEKVFPHVNNAERTEVIEYYLDRVGLADSMDKRSSDMSNGMRQRVGLARAFALSPKLLLLDEPFGMLDALTRWELQEVLMEVWKRSQITAICVTHDVDEAILLADRVVMMTNGPHARVGKIMEVNLPRPRTRKALLEHPQYWHYRAELLGFLEEYETNTTHAA
jgi:nitrate/nitrite transport system ATP-binding protein